jgi:PAS domain S-box-containing protein
MFFRNSIVWKLALPLPIGLMLCLFIAWLALPRLIAQNTEDAAIQAAVQTVNQYKTLRRYYTNNVIKKAIANGSLKPSLNHSAEPGGIPLPATLIHDMSALLKDEKTSIALYSGFPFPLRKDRILDDFQTQAWEFLKRNPNEVFSREEQRGDTHVVRVAVADKMVAEACVNCHNEHPLTPRTGWNLGDVRGVLEVTTNIDSAVTGATRLTNTILLGMLLLGLCLIGLIFAGARAIAKPIVRLTETMKQLADGDLSAEMPVNDRMDEVGQMTKAIQVFKNNAIKQKAEELELAQHRDELQKKDEESTLQNLRFNAAIENMSQGLCMFDANQRLIVCNKLYASIYGIPPELATPGTTFRQILEYRIENGVFGEGDPEKYIKERMAWVGKRKQSSKVQHLSDGRSLQIKTRPLPGSGWLGTHEDVTARIQTEEALLESEARLRAVFDNTPICINMKDTEGRYILANKPYEEWWGYTLEDVIGKKANEVQDSGDGLKAMSAAEQIVLDTGKTHECEIRVQRPQEDGPFYDRLLIKFPVKSSDGKITAIGTVAIDITERKKVEKEIVRHRDHLQELVDAATRELKANAEGLKEALAKEKELNELQRQFVSMASHEFRTPLTIIDGAAQRLMRRLNADRLTPEDALQRINKIRSAVQRMTRLMESTLTAARLDEGKIAIKIGSCEIGNIVKEVCVRQQDIIQTHVISCELTELPESILADTDSVEQVLTNLLSNAVKYSPEAQIIEVRGWREGHQVVISVRDYGIGIDEEEFPEIGQRFFRAKTSTGIAGTGIGLNMVKTLVEMHGGTVNFESIKGEGSTFTVHLPIAGPDQSEETANKVA